MNGNQSFIQEKSIHLETCSPSLDTMTLKNQPAFTCIDLLLHLHSLIESLFRSHARNESDCQEDRTEGRNGLMH